MTRMEKKNLLSGLLFVSPWLIGIAVFLLYPILASLYYSFCEYSVLTRPQWIGLGNYVDLFSDEVFWISLWNTFYFAIFSLPLTIVFALAVAFLLNTSIKGMGVYRAIIFVPTLVPKVAMAVLFMWIFNSQFGILNYLLGLFGISGPDWLGSSFWSKPSLIIMSLWGIGNTVVLLLAALQEVPASLYEAAEIDGANWFQKIRYVSIPMVSPVIFFVLITGVIGVLQIFTGPYILTGGGPARSTLFYTMYLFDNGFRYLRMGYACSMAWILFLIILVLTWLTNKISSKHVHYMGK